MRLRLEREAPQFAAGVFESKERVLEAKGFVRAIRRGFPLDELELLVVHIPKTGGTSLEKALQPHGLVTVRSLAELSHLVHSGQIPRKLSINHLDPTLLLRCGFLSREGWQRLAVVCQIRNPFARLWSAWHHHNRGTRTRLRPSETFSSYMRAVTRNSYRTRYSNALGLSHGAPQEHWFSFVDKSPRGRVFTLENQENLLSYMQSAIHRSFTVPHVGAAPVAHELPDNLPYHAEFIDRYRKDFARGQYSTDYGGANTRLDPIED